MSAANTKTQDPSMEEILASIRRIIADEGDPSAPAAVEMPGEGPAEPSKDDVLDLAEVPEAKLRVPAALEIEVPELSFQDRPPEPAEPTPGPDAASAPAPRQAGLAEAAPEQPSAERAEPAGQELPGAEALISREASASVTHAFNLLSHTILSQNARTLEDLVQEMLKPMLKVWLDDNLPPLVERLVRAEIERVARGSR